MFELLTLRTLHADISAQQTASNVNDKKIRHFKYHQLDKWVVQGHVTSLLTKPYTCCLLCSDSQRGEMVPFCRFVFGGGQVQCLLQWWQTEISATYSQLAMAHTLSRLFSEFCCPLLFFMDISLFLACFVYIIIVFFIFVST